MTTPETALLACLLAGWPGAQKCHEELVAKGPAAIADLEPGLMTALKAIGTPEAERLLNDNPPWIPVSN